MDGIDASSAATENPTSASHETYPAVKFPYAEGLRSWGTIVATAAGRRDEIDGCPMLAEFTTGVVPDFKCEARS